VKEAWNVPMKGEQNFLHGMIKNKKGSDEQVVGNRYASLSPHPIPDPSHCLNHDLTD